MAEEGRKHGTLSTIGEAGKGALKWGVVAALAVPVVGGLAVGGLAAALLPIGAAAAIGVGIAGAVLTGLFASPVIAGSAVLGGVAGTIGGVSKANSETRAYERTLTKEAREERREAAQDSIAAQTQMAAMDINNAVASAVQMRDAQWENHLSQQTSGAAAGIAEGMSHVSKHRPNGEITGDQRLANILASKQQAAGVAQG